MFSALTFNMQNGEPWQPGADGAAPPDLDGTIAFLRSTEADIFLLQEVEEGIDGGGQAEPPRHFTKLREAFPDYHAVFSYPPDNPDELPFGIGLAIFSRFPLEGFWCEALAAAPVPFEYGGRARQPSQRLLIGATAALDGGRSLELLNTHLQAFFMIGARAGYHPEQRERVLARMAAAGPAVLLGGDFNCAPEDDLVHAFEAAGFEPAQNVRPTWKRRPYVLDHLFHGPALRKLDCEVLRTKASDHDGVLARYEFVE